MHQLHFAQNWHPDDQRQMVNRGSEKFEQYRENIKNIAWRLADERYEVAQSIDNSYFNDYYPGNNRDTMPVGYSTTNPEVAIPAFLAAYTDQDPNTMSLAYLSNWAILRPTWRVKYDGLKNIGNLNKRFRNITLTHGYNATFTISSFGSNVNYDYDQASNGTEWGSLSWVASKVDSSLYVPEFDVISYAATEQFMPLIGIDITWKNNVLSKFEFKKTRALTMSLANNQMSEVYTTEYVFGSGYRFDDLKLILNGKPFVSDLNLRGDLSIRDNISVSRNLAQSFNDITAGQRSLAINITADYQFTKKLMLRGYFRHNLTDPKISTTYRNSETQFGFEVRFSLAQ